MKEAVREQGADGASDGRGEVADGKEGKSREGAGLYALALTTFTAIRTHVNCWHPHLPHLAVFNRTGSEQINSKVQCHQKSEHGCKAVLFASCGDWSVLHNAFA